ncbi:hypothetical protein Ahy_B01g055126 [Arachis hypogaea]|uniref:Uncharacterized protein n=1 Tax=Arachis hypogaea TaxID=3818 RepID=A0A445AV77_ARAHY|nr:hypothetical protein Ahy_B01g055126 [Arachis hypogaea]
MEQVRRFIGNQKALHGYKGGEDLNSLWSEDFPVSMVADAYCQNPADVKLVQDTGDTGDRSSVNVYWLNSGAEAHTGWEKLTAAENAEKKPKGDKAALEARLVVLGTEKKQLEVAKEDHGLEMFAAGFDRAVEQARLLAPEVDLSAMDPCKVVVEGELVEDEDNDGKGEGENSDN